jgi:hypothetical protein
MRRNVPALLSLNKLPADKGLPPMDMPYHLKTLPPEALDILRFFRTLDTSSAHADDIIEGAELSDRGFGKAIRRLVTKSYLVMDGDQVYRLSDMGRRAVEELGGLDQLSPEERAQMSEVSDEEFSITEPRFVKRHLVLVTPAALRPDQPTNIYVGFDEAQDDEAVSTSLDLVLRLNILHGEPQQARETSLTLENRAAHQTFEVTAGHYQQARLRVQVSQYQQDTLDLEPCGGLYVDLPVQTDPAHTAPVAFGGDVTLREDVRSEPSVDDDFDFSDLDFE